jgi:hypothetical protein
VCICSIVLSIIVIRQTHVTYGQQVGVICQYVIVIELHKMRLFIYIPIWMDQIWTFNLVSYTLTGLFAQRITCFPFMVYLISCIYDMTPLRQWQRAGSTIRRLYTGEHARISRRRGLRGGARQAGMYMCVICIGVVCRMSYVVCSMQYMCS